MSLGDASDEKTSSRRRFQNSGMNPPHSPLLCNFGPFVIFEKTHHDEAFGRGMVHFSCFSLYGFETSIQ